MVLRRSLTLLLAAAVLACAPAAARAPLAEDRDALTGRWQLDGERSDDARGALDDAARDVAGDLRPRRIRSGSAGRPRRPATGRSIGRELFAPVRVPERRVELTFDDAAVAFHRDAHAPERIWLDGRPSVVDADNPEARIGAWEASVLWIERSSQRGTRVVESWRREGPDLVADFEIRNGLLEDPVSFTLVFVPEPDE